MVDPFPLKQKTFEFHVQHSSHCFMNVFPQHWYALGVSGHPVRKLVHTLGSGLRWKVYGGLLPEVAGMYRTVVSSRSGGPDNIASSPGFRRYLEVKVLEVREFLLKVFFRGPGYPRLRGRCFGFQEARGCFGNRVQRKVGFWEARFSCFGQVFGVSGNGFVASPVNTRV